LINTSRLNLYMVELLSKANYSTVTFEFVQLPQMKKSKLRILHQIMSTERLYQIAGLKC